MMQSHTITSDHANNNKESDCHCKLVVFGDPATGKSTLVRALSEVGQLADLDDSYEGKLK